MSVPLFLPKWNQFEREVQGADRWRYDVTVVRKLVRLEKVTSAVWLRGRLLLQPRQADLSSQTQRSSWSPSPQGAGLYMLVGSGNS